MGNGWPVGYVRSRKSSGRVLLWPAQTGLEVQEIYKRLIIKLIILYDPQVMLWISKWPLTEKQQQQPCYPCTMRWGHLVLCVDSHFLQLVKTVMSATIWNISGVRFRNDIWTFYELCLDKLSRSFFFSVVKSAARLIILLDFNFYFSVKCCEIRKAWPEVRTWTFLGSLSLTVSDLVLSILTSFASFVKRSDNTLDFKTLAWELNFLWLYVSISL